MSHAQVTLPVFGSSSQAPASASSAPDGAQSGAGNEWQMDSSGDPMDFDLLAEYLLEDNTATSSGLNFDFHGDPTNASSVVSPEQSLDGGVAQQTDNNGAAQAQQIITQHATGIQHQVVASRMHSAPAPLAPAPSPLAAAPLVHPAQAAPQQAMVAARGMPLQVGSAPVSYVQPTTHIAPAPSIPNGGGGMNTGMGQQPTTAVTKRRRMDVPGAVAMGVAPGAAPILADPMAVAAALQGRGRKKTQAQIDRRRERNRILARRTRLRKKFFFESLQKEVVDLQRENAALKDIVRSELSDDGKQLLSECNATEKLPQAVLEACGENASDYDQQDFNLVRSIQQSQHSFVITDPSLQDNPIVFASDDFLSLTGYSREDVLGRNCRFLQGSETSQDKIDEIRKGLANGEDITVTFVNYTADGSPFWNKLFIAALRDAQNNVVNFIGVVVKVAGPEPGDPEHGKVLAGIDSDLYDDDMLNDDNDDGDAEETAKAIEGAVDAAVAAAPAVVHG